MNLLFYAPVADATGNRLQRVVEALVLPEEIEICRTMAGLLAALRRPTHDLIIAVLLAATNEDLTGFLALRPLLSNVRVILILPDRDNETVARAHFMRPRFLAYADSDFIDVAAVLHKMLANTHGEGMKHDPRSYH